MCLLPVLRHPSIYCDPAAHQILKQMKCLRISADEQYQSNKAERCPRIITVLQVDKGFSGYSCRNNLLDLRTYGTEAIYNWISKRKMSWQHHTFMSIIDCLRNLPAIVDQMGYNRNIPTFK